MRKTSWIKSQKKITGINNKMFNSFAERDESLIIIIIIIWIELN